MNKVELFKINDNLSTMLQLQSDLISSNLFKLPEKKALTEKTDVTKEDVMLATSNVSDFITVWYRHARNGKKRNEAASYGIRVKTALGDIPALKVLLGNNISFNDTSEYRVTCYSAEDVKFFTTSILLALQKHAVKRQTKEVVNATALAV